MESPYGGGHNKYINALKVLQKKATRIIDNASYNSHTNSLFLNMKIIKLTELHEWHLANLMFRH